MIGIEDDSLRWFAAERVEVEPDVTALVATYSGVLYRVAFSVLRNMAEAEDVVQDTFVRVLEKRGSLGEVREFRPWLVRIAWNLALDRRRRAPVEQMDAVFAEGLVSKDVAADVALEDVQQMMRVLLEMDGLPKGERFVLLLSAVDELGTAEIGTVLGKSESAVRALLFRARTRLKERLMKGGLR